MIRRFNRFELKYLVHARQRSAIIHDLLQHMRMDSYAKPNGFYQITSLYYDSPDFCCFWSKVDGIKYRRKVRIRVYGSQAQTAKTQTMVEIKQRINRTVQKRRLTLDRDKAYALCDQGKQPILENTQDRIVASEVSFLQRTLCLKPACVISYLRQAFVGGNYEPGIRVTFDQDLCYSTPDARLDYNTNAHCFLPPDMAVMEVKVNETVPLWLVHLLTRHQCTLQRISKYCSGVSRLRALEYPAEQYGVLYG